MFSIDVRTVQQLHDRAIGASGGSLGLREPGMLISVCEKPQASFGGEDLYPALADKAAALFEALVNYHVFVDGNKRTAVMVLNYFLEQNECKLTASDDELEVFTIKVATSHPDLGDVAKWIKSHSRSEEAA